MRATRFGLMTLTLSCMSFACSQEDKASKSQSAAAVAPSKPKAMAVGSQPEEGLEAMRAPDDMFFAMAYLDEFNGRHIRDWPVMALTNEANTPVIADELDDLANDRSEIFAPERDRKRLALAAMVFMKLADRDGDKRLSQEEFMNYRGPSVVQIKMGQDDWQAARASLFASMAGERDSLTVKDLFQFLELTWQTVAQARTADSKQERANRILTGWRQYALAHFDDNQDGQLSFEEQQAMVKERQRELANLKNDYRGE